jgi:predicted dehydrogenase
MMTRIGIVGSGYMASEYLKASEAVEGIDFVSIFSRNKGTASALAKQFGVSKIANSVEDFFGLNLDFIVVCVPELATFEIITTFSKVGVPLLVEKPVGLTLAEALAIENYAKVSSIQIFAALNRRFYRSSQNVLEELAESSEKRFIQVNDQENTLAAMAAGQPQQVVDNWMFANSIHIIDYIAVVCRGEPTVQYKKITPLNENAFVLLASIVFSSGDEALYICSWNVPGGWSVNISTASKNWQLSPLEIARSRGLGDRQYKQFELDPIDSDYKPGLVRILMELEKCSKSQKHSLTTISEANRTMQLIDLIYSND